MALAMTAFWAEKLEHYWVPWLPVTIAVTESLQTR